MTSTTTNNILSEVFTYESLVHAISGMTGGVTAITTFYPLNVVRTKLQVEEGLKAKGNAFSIALELAEKDGFASLYQGWWSAVVSLGASNFVYFYAYNALKAVYRKEFNKPNVDAISNLGIASVAGVINVLLTTPLWVAGTRLTIQKEGKGKYNGVAHCLMSIVRDEGLLSLWSGLVPSLALVSNPTIQFFTYERLRAPMVRRAQARGSPITSLEFFVMGAIAKAVATILTYPIQVAQSRLRADRKAASGQAKKYKGTFHCLAQIYATSGFLGWFKGMEAKLWQTVLTAAFQFLTYEQVQKVVFLLLLGKKKPEVAAH